jgi:hypothetical protein
MSGTAGITIARGHFRGTSPGMPAMAHPSDHCDGHPGRLQNHEQHRVPDAAGGEHATDAGERSSAALPATLLSTGQPGRLRTGTVAGARFALILESLTTRPNGRSDANCHPAARRKPQSVLPLMPEAVPRDDPGAEERKQRHGNG